MPIRREFFDWQRPALAQAAAYLRDRFQEGGTLDLSQTIVVVPGGRAHRRLLEILVTDSDDRQLELTPPHVVTPDFFPELLYCPQKPFADTLTQQLAWVAALQAAPAKSLAAFLPVPPAPHDTARWFAVGETLRRLHLELAADGLDCDKVLAGAEAVEGFAEHDRWQALCLLQRLYHDTLDRLSLWDKQSARLVAIRNRNEIKTDKQIVLVGMVDLNNAQRAMLDQVADRVTALVFAPPQLAERFDEHGCLIPDKWTDAEVPLADDQIERVDGPADQAEAVTRWLADLNGKYRADEVVIGLPDARLAPQIERQLAQCGVHGRSATGKTLPETGPFRLLQCAALCAAGNRFRDLAALVRHPDVHDWLIPLFRAAGHQGSLLAALDRYASARYPARLDAERLAKDSDATAVLAIYKIGQQLIDPLLAPPRSLRRWAAPLRQVLATVYADRLLDRDAAEDRYVWAALAALRDALDRLAQLPAALDPEVDARTACHLVLDALVTEAIPPPADPDAIELLGWLDLPLDDAPLALVTTFNEGWVPSSSTADALLPNRLRQSLGLLHNDRRLARDAYALSLLCASRQELRVLVAHRDPDGNPLAPSRLLFLTDAERAVARSLACFGKLPAPAPRRNLLTPPAGPRHDSGLFVPPPEPQPAPLADLGVTQFRDYIACPYRFYLKHVLKLKPATDDIAELDGAAFGDLVHRVLELFGRADDAQDVRTTADAKKITAYLDDQLDRVTAARFGPAHARPAVRVQIEQLRLRLRAFAQWQALRAAAGWRIAFCEDSESNRTLTAALYVDESVFTVRGRIDRIDYHESLARLCVLDYKTADHGKPPEKTHRRREEWIDLQLPLYRHLVKTLQAAGELSAAAKVELGYVVLPHDVTAVGLELADWNDELLQTADERAVQIIRAIRAERFWPPATPPPEFSADYAAICQDRRMGGAPRDPGGGG